MKFRITSLLSLLSSITFLSQSAVCMLVEDAGGKTTSIKVKKPLTREKKDLRAFLSKQDYPGAFKTTKATLPPTVPDEYIVNFLMTSNKYPGWDTVDPEDKAWVVAKIRKAARRKNLVTFLGKKNYPGAFIITRAGLLPAVSDGQIVDFLMTSNKYPGWDKVDLEDKAWVVAKITKAARRKDLVSFLSKQDYPGAFNGMKATTTASDEVIVNFLMKSNTYPGWDKVDPEDKAWVVGTIVSKAKQQELEKIIRQPEFFETYRNLKSLGIIPSDREVLTVALESKGYTGWKDLTPALQEWVVADMMLALKTPKTPMRKETKKVATVSKLPVCGAKKGRLSVEEIVSDYNYHREKKNAAPDKALIDFLVKSKYYAEWKTLSAEERDAFVGTVVSKAKQQSLIVAREYVLGKIKMIHEGRVSDRQGNFETLARDPKTAYSIGLVREELPRIIKFNPLLTIKTPNEIEKMFSILVTQYPKTYTRNFEKVSETLKAIKANISIGVGVPDIKSTDFLLEVATLISHVALKDPYYFNAVRVLFFEDLATLKDPSPAALVGSVVETYFKGYEYLLSDGE